MLINVLFFLFLNTIIEKYIGKNSQDALIDS